MPTLNKLTLLFIVTLCVGLVSSAQARTMENYSTVQIRALDKITARTLVMDVPIGDTVEFGSLFIKAEACRKAPPIEQPESASFLEIWEFPINKEETIREEEPIWVYSGWMFASSPGLASMDHPIYDIWVLDCVGEQVATAPGFEFDEEASQDEELFESE